MTGPVTSVRPATILQILRRRVETTVIVRPTTPASVGDIVTSAPLTGSVMSNGGGVCVCVGGGGNTRDTTVLVLGFSETFAGF